MNQPVPLIYAPLRPPARVGQTGRLLAAAAAAGCLGVLIIALWLDPSGSGIGTHERLGLQPCGWAARGGLPCPSCGMTTSFAWLVRGHLAASFYVQPMGAILGLITAMTFWASLYIAITAKPAHRLLQMVPAGYWLVPLMLFGLLAWGWKILLRLNGLDGWE